MAQIVQRIRNEPFLFVIAIVILLVGLAIQATSLASPDLRFLITVIALLVFAVLLGYYVLEGWKLYEKARRQAAKTTQESTPDPIAPAGPSVRGKVQAGEVSGDAQVGGVKAPAEVLNYPGGISGEVKVDKASGGETYGVEIDHDADAGEPGPDPSP